MDTTRATRDYHFVRYFPAKRSGAADDAGFLGAYQWLSSVPVPHMVREAIGLWRAIDASDGTTAEAISPAEVASALRGNCAPSFDAVPRAGLVLAVLAYRARKTVPETPQCALDWAIYGTAAGQPRLGDILCTLSDGGAHVGLYVGEDETAFHCLGVTGSDRIGVARIAKTKLYAVRRPLYECVRFATTGILLNQDGTRRR